MLSAEMLFITLPLFVLLIGLSAFELKTTLIPDKVVFPAAAYLLGARAIVGPEAWWHYPASLASMLVFFLLLAALIERLWEVDSIGGGAIKLMAVMGAALGFTATFHFGILLIGVVLLALLGGRFMGLPTIPSSIYALLSFFLITAFRDSVHVLL